MASPFRRDILGIIFMVAAALAMTAPLAAGADSYPRTICINLTLAPGSAAELARYDHVAYNFRAPLSLRQSVRALNPSSIDFCFISSMTVPCDAAYGLQKAIWDSADAYGWWLYHSNGDHVLPWCPAGEVEWALDMTDDCPRSPRGERFRDWYARTLRDTLVVGRQFHGIFLDQCHTTIYWLRDCECNPNQVPLDLNRDGIGDEDSTVTRKWAAGVYDFLRQLRQLVGPNYPIICNGAVNLLRDTGGKNLNDWLNGNQFECFLYLSPLHDDWYRNMFYDNRGYFPEEAATQPLGGQKWMVIGDSGLCMGLSGSELERQKRLTLGSCLLTDAYYIRPPYDDNEWEPEYDLCLGQPSGPPDSLAGGSIGVWVREFTSGFVAVNPNSYAVTVPGRNITVPGRDAVISINPPDRAALALAATYTTSIQVRFTVPGDPYGCGHPSTYRLRARDPQNVDHEWTGTVTASIGGTQTITASSLTPGTPYRLTLTTEITGGGASAASDTLRASTLAGPDTQPPSAVTNLAPVDSTTSSLTLSWTAPADPPTGGAAAAYEMRRWTDGGSWATGTVVSGLPSPAPAGTQQTTTVSGLSASTSYHFQMRARDTAGNWSGLSNVAAGRTATPPDTQAPAAVTTLAAVDSSATTLTLRWTAPSDQPSGGAATAYEMRRWTDGGSWSEGASVAGLPAPAAPGAQQTLVVPGLASSTPYHFQLRSRDAAENWSDLSNEASARTKAAPDTVPPEGINDLAFADSTQTSLTLRWTAPSDPPAGGAAAAYEIRTWTDGGSWSSGDEVSGVPAPAAPGTMQTWTLPNLAPSTRYHAALRARDAAGNWSELSNEADAHTRAPDDTAPPAAISTLAAVDSSDTSLLLRWTAPSDPPSGSAAAAYEMHWWIDGGTWMGGTDVSGLPEPAEPGTQQTVQVSGLAPSTRVHAQIRSRDAAGNWSGVSNEAIARTRATPDTEPPTAVATLAVVDSTASTLTLRWTAPADPPSGGAATSYELRRWTDGGDWAGGVDVPVLAAPAPPGTQDSVVAVGLEASTDYRFQIRSRDAAGNVSALSNEASARTQAAPDTEPPAAVTDLLVVDATESSITLHWTAPADPPSQGPSSAYEARAWSAGGSWSSGTQLPVPTPDEPGVEQTLVATGLDPQTPYAFAIRSRDESGNLSALSNTATGSTKEMPDRIPPAAVADLVVHKTTDTTIDLQWTAPSDPPHGDRVAGYEVRFWKADSAASAVVFRTPDAPSPSEPGSSESYVLEGLEPATEYCATVASFDASGNASDPSNVATGSTEEPADTAAPAVVSDLAASAVSSTRIALTWTAPSDAPGGGPAVAYEIRRWRPGGDWESGTPIAAPSPGLPDALESLDVEGLVPAATYIFALRSIDSSGNASAVSNTASATTAPPADTQPPSAPASLTAVLDDGAVDLWWPASPDADVLGYHVYRRAGGSEREQLTAAPLTATQYTDPETPVEETRYSVTAVDASGNESAFSIEAVVEPPDDPTAPGFQTNPHPNPFRASTTFLLRLDPDGRAPRVAVYDVAGRFVASLEGHIAGDTVEFVWDGRGSDGTQVASGLYLCRVESARGLAWRRVSLIR